MANGIPSGGPSPISQTNQSPIEQQRDQAFELKLFGKKFSVGPASNAFGRGVRAVLTSLKLLRPAEASITQQSTTNQVAGHQQTESIPKRVPLKQRSVETVTPNASIHTPSPQPSSTKPPIVQQILDGHFNTGEDGDFSIAHFRQTLESWSTAELKEFVKKGITKLPHGQTQQVTREVYAQKKVADSLAKGFDGDVEKFKQELTKNYNSNNSELKTAVLSEIDKQLGLTEPLTTPDIEALTTPDLKEEASALHKELEQWNKQSGVKTRMFSPAQPKTPLPPDEKAFFKDHIRYAFDSTSGIFARDTAITLPESDGFPAHRLSANKFRMAPTEPETILMQAPKTEAAGDTWHMLFANNTECVVDLTQPTEVPRKADIYYPQRAGQSIDYQSGDKTFTVMLKKPGDDLGDGLKRYEYQVTDQETGEQKTIFRLHFENWVDMHGVDPEILDKVINETDRITGHDGIAAVHCSAGIGRTGTFVSARAAKHTLEGQQLDLSGAKKTITDLTKTGRQNRNQNFIQKPEQMETLLKYLTVQHEFGSVLTSDTESLVKTTPSSPQSGASHNPSPIYQNTSEALERSPSKVAPTIPQKGPKIIADNISSKFEQFKYADWDLVDQDLKKLTGSPESLNILSKKIEGMRKTHGEEQVNYMLERIALAAGNAGSVRSG